MKNQSVKKNIRKTQQRCHFDEERGELEITDLNKVYLKKGDLKLRKLNRGTAWLDMGTPSSLLGAGHFVETLETRQGLKIGCLEEVAWRMKWITNTQLAALAEPLAKSRYGQYLQNLLKYETRG